MSETKEQIAEERDALRAENDRLHEEVAKLQAAAGPARGYAPAQQFMLSEGDRQELVQRGVVAIGGRLRTRAQVAEMLGDRQAGIDLGTASPSDVLLQEAERGAIRGVDYVYPSVAPGQIDPAVAGTPGINGPAATDADVSRETTVGETVQRLRDVL